MAFAFLVIVTLALLYWFPVRRWFARWGSTDEDLAREMTGDVLIANPTHSATHAVTVDARPEDIWPWLVQMGAGRGGLYSYDWLDRLFGYFEHPSTDRVLPEFQHLAVGDVIPLDRGKGFPVSAIEPYRALVLSDTVDGFQWVWQFGLYPLDEDRTRLVSRGAQRFASTIGTWFFMRVMEPAAFIMTRRMLLGVKQRAETLRVRSFVAQRCGVGGSPVARHVVARLHCCGGSVPRSGRLLWRHERRREPHAERSGDRPGSPVRTTSVR